MECPGRLHAFANTWRSMDILDYLIVAAYIVASLLVGLKLSRRNRSESEFLLAGRSMHWFPVGISVMATVFSAVNIAAFSGEVFSHGLYVAASLPVFLLIALPVTRWFVPFYTRLRAVSAYEFLERRFDRRARRFASLLFILWRLLWMSVVTYATARLLAPLTGMPFQALALLCGAAAVAYTAAGGMRAVMWTDVLQLAIILASLVLAVSIAARAQHGLPALLRTAAEGGLMRPFHPFDPDFLSLDPTIRITLWSGLIGTFTAFLARYGADQMVVQRYLSARSEQDARRGFVLNVFCSLAALIGLAFLGFAMFAHAAAAGTIHKPGMRPLTYLATFILALPSGARGLLIAAILASTMSSIDSGIHACCTAFVTDFRRNRTPAQVSASGGAVRSERRLVVAIGVLTVFLALFVGKLGTVFEIANRIINGLGSPLLAVCLIGMFARGVTANGLLYGGIAGTAASITISVCMAPLALHYYAVLNLLVTVILCYAFSLPVPGGRN